jgi:hypothetical protein
MKLRVSCEMSWQEADANEDEDKRGEGGEIYALRSRTGGRCIGERCIGGHRTVAV